MTAQIEADVSSLADLEFAKDCNWKGCDTQARWSMWHRHMSFPSRGCEFSTMHNVCDSHKKLFEELLTEATRLRIACRRCGHLYAGQLSDNFRVIRL